MQAVRQYGVCICKLISTGIGSNGGRLIVIHPLAVVRNNKLFSMYSFYLYGFRIIRNCCVGCGGRRRFWQSRHVQCVHRERRVECERGKSRTNRTRRRGQYSRSKRLSSLLLHMYATAYYTIVRPYRHPTRRRTPLFSLYGQHPRRRSCGGCCRRRRFYRRCV